MEELLKKYPVNPPKMIMSIPQIKERLPYLVNAFSFLSPKPINIGVRMVNGHSQPAGRK